jgi:hypothetical protein
MCTGCFLSRSTTDQICTQAAITGRPSGLRWWTSRTVTVNPGGHVGPGGPAGPVAPCGPSAPGGPAGPSIVAPGGPGGPVAPSGPLLPRTPGVPWRPGAPGGPVPPTGPGGPGAPAGPGGPAEPCGPGDPCGPAGPRSPCGPGTSTTLVGSAVTFATVAIVNPADIANNTTATARDLIYQVSRLGWFVLGEAGVGGPLAQLERPHAERGEIGPAEVQLVGQIVDLPTVGAAVAATEFAYDEGESAGGGQNRADPGGDRRPVHRPLEDFDGEEDGAHGDDDEGDRVERDAVHVHPSFATGVFHCVA